MKQEAPSIKRQVSSISIRSPRYGDGEGDLLKGSAQCRIRTRNKRNRFAQGGSKGPNRDVRIEGKMKWGEWETG